jgi:AhpC/TSA family
VWQTLYNDLKDTGFMVVAVAEESRGAEQARPWIEQSGATYWTLIDPEHRVSALYGMVNVPQAVWIDEHGSIVRPAETAGSTDHFRRMDRDSKVLPPDAFNARAEARALYLDAVRDWVRNGNYALSPKAAARRQPRITTDIVLALAHFRLGLWLREKGRVAEGDRHLAEASRLHPESWSLWRQAADLEKVGNAVGAAFWERVDALGDKAYYAPPDIPGFRPA